MDANKENLKQYLKDYTDYHLERSKSGLYICPFCNSGTGRNRTGAFSIKGDKWTCFSCNRSGDLFDLIGAIENLATYPERLARAEQLYGTGSQPVKKSKAQPPAEIDYTSFIEEANKHLQETDYHRGISLETLNRFNVGYITGGKLPGYDRPTTPRLIIPTSRHSFIARDTTGTAEPKVLKSKGKMHIFNGGALIGSDRPIFITEGEIDALSIIDLGAEAVGIGGTGGTNRLLQAIEQERPQQPLIIALDHDEAGEAAADALAAELTEKGIDYIMATDLYGDYKDANEALTKDKAEFSARIRQTEKAAAANADKLKEQAAENLEAEREKYKRENNAVEHLIDFLNAMEVETPCISTGFETLDYALGGGLYEGLYIIGAISSLGKTTFTLQVADNIARSGRDVLIFSLEMARTELMAKSISRLTLETALEKGGRGSDAKTARQITTKEKRKYFTQAEKELLAIAINKYGEYAENIYIYEGDGEIGAQRVWEIVDKHTKVMGQPPVVIIDYLQMLAPYSEKYGDKQNTDKAVLEMKRLSRHFKTPVIAISSFNRTNYNTPVTMEAFKESGAIEYGSDVLIGLQLKGVGEPGFDANEAKQKNPREVELIILKNRHGETGRHIEFWYNAPLNYFNEKSIEPPHMRTRV